jgi:hypothetical protein
VKSKTSGNSAATVGLSGNARFDEQFHTAGQGSSDNQYNICRNDMLLFEKNQCLHFAQIILPFVQRDTDIVQPWRYG